MLHSKPTLIGITGGIGSGKSLITKIFQCLQVPVYDADSRAKRVMTTDGILIDQIKKEFGNLSYDGKNLNRTFLAGEVFSKPDRLKKLNELVHPRVALDFEQWVAQQANAKYVIKEAALMIESGSSKGLDKLIVVTAPKEIRITRVMKRDNRSREEVINIMNNQLSEDDSQ
jgi:dephospho-CoA kinase